MIETDFYKHCFLAANLLKRKAESSSSEPMIKIWKPELTSQTDSTESMYVIIV